jgi:hypothetical protein
MHPMSPRQLASRAFLCVAVFPAIVVLLNVVQHANYDPKVQAISELALGRGGVLMVVAFLSLASGIALLALILGRTLVRGRAIRWLLYVAAVLAGPMSAFFHTDLTGYPTSTHGTIHNNSGLAAFLLMLASMHVSGWLFRHQPTWRGFAMPTLVWAVAATGAFLLIPALPFHFGLAQRIFVGSFVSWLLAATAYARHMSLPTGGVSFAAGTIPVRTEM